MGQYLECNHLHLMEDIDKHMKDLVIEIFSKTLTEMRKSALRRDIRHADPGISAVPLSPIFVME